MSRAPEVVEFSVRMPAPMHAKLAKLAKRELSSLNREVLIAVRTHLHANEEGK